jgi:hypothetical protein
MGDRLHDPVQDWAILLNCCGNYGYIATFSFANDQKTKIYALRIHIESESREHSALSEEFFHYFS